MSIRDVIVSIRPRQWLKNLSLFAAATFWGDLVNWPILLKVSLGAIAFCGLSSAMYLFNDVVDAPEDRRHPKKKNRPIAAGRISSRNALLIAALLAILSLTLAWRLSPHFLILALAYTVLQIAYSLKLRSIVIIDTLAVAMGFIIRVYAGSWIVPVPLSSWLALSTIGLSLVIAFGKRRSEKSLAEKSKKFGTRVTLELYPEALLDSVISMSAAIAAMSYFLFTFQTSPRTQIFLTEVLPATVAQPKWLMLTVPLVIYGLARYLYVIYEKHEGESPEEILFSDKPLLATVGLWIAAVVGVIYFLPG